MYSIWLKGATGAEGEEKPRLGGRRLSSAGTDDRQPGLVQGPANRASAASGPGAEWETPALICTCCADLALVICDLRGPGTRDQRKVGHGS